MIAHLTHHHEQKTQSPKQRYHGRYYAEHYNPKIVSEAHNAKQARKGGDSYDPHYPQVRTIETRLFLTKMQMKGGSFQDLREDNHTIKDIPAQGRISTSEERTPSRGIDPERNLPTESQAKHVFT